MNFNIRKCIFTKTNAIIIFIALSMGAIAFQWNKHPPSTLNIEMRTTSKGTGQIYWDSGSAFSEKQSTKFSVKPASDFIEYKIVLPPTNLGKIRIDPLDRSGTFEIKSIILSTGQFEHRYSGNVLYESISELQNVSTVTTVTDRYSGKATSDDPSLLFDAPIHSLSSLQNRIKTSVLIGITSFFVSTFLFNFVYPLRFKPIADLKKFCQKNCVAIVACTLMLVIVATKWNIVNLPYHWDELCAYVEPSHWLATKKLHSALPGFHPPTIFFGHPFGLYLCVSIFYRIFGEAPVVTHSLILSISFLGLFYTYLLGRLLYNNAVGIISASLLFLSPLYFAQCGMLNGDTVITTFGVITVYYFLKNDYPKYLMSGCFLVLTKEAAIAYIVAILLYSVIAKRNETHLSDFLLKHSVPLIVILLFFVAQKTTTGQFLPNAYFSDNDFAVSSINALLERFKLVISWAFFTQSKAYLLPIIALALVQNTLRKKEILLFLIIFAFFVSAYSYIYYLARYIMPIYPFFFIIAAASIYHVFKFNEAYVVVTCITCILFVKNIYGSGSGLGSNETDMQYKDVVLSHSDAMEYVEKHLNRKTVLTNFPLQAGLTKPHLGYVNRPISTTNSPSAHYDVVMYSPQSDLKSSIILSKLISSEHLILIKGFYRNGKSTEIFGRE